ncbi:AlpA family transcriptional regulator [Ralstonia sp.]|uniref:helix-turn-helix transcriptional regulator n=1 Tax=Ralstonia sp. TaxID=54061 RepID=UPI0031D03D86
MRLIRMPEVIKMVGLGKTAIYDRIKDHRFPAPIKLGRASAWVESEVQEWIAERVRQRDGSRSG